MKYFNVLWICLLAATQLTYAQSAESKPAIFGLFDVLHITTQQVQKVAPHFPVSSEQPNIFDDKINAWIDNYPEEWTALRKINGLSEQNVNWLSYGVESKWIGQEPEIFENTHWQWYLASGVSDEVRLARFPHFPIPEKLINTSDNLLYYSGLVGAWMRLYPKEYQAFLSTPEIQKLGNYKMAEATIPYFPKFIGALITSKRPTKANTGNTVKDEYEYQLALRHWYFIYDIKGYEELYASDYDFPSDFDPIRYRIEIKSKISSIERGDVGEDDLKLKNALNSQSSNCNTDK